MCGSRPPRHSPITGRLGSPIQTRGAKQNSDLELESSGKRYTVGDVPLTAEASLEKRSALESVPRKTTGKKNPAMENATRFPPDGRPFNWSGPVRRRAFYGPPPISGLGSRPAVCCVARVGAVISWVGVAWARRVDRHQTMRPRPPETLAWVRPPPGQTARWENGRHRRPNQDVFFRRSRRQELPGSPARRVAYHPATSISSGRMHTVAAWAPARTDNRLIGPAV